MKAFFVYFGVSALALSACTTGSMLTSRPVYDDLYYSSRVGVPVQVGAKQGGGESQVRAFSTQTIDAVPVQQAAVAVVPNDGLTEYERYRLALEANDTLQLARILGGYYSNGTPLSNDTQSNSTYSENENSLGGGDTYNINVYVDEWGNPYYSSRFQYSYYGGWGSWYDPWYSSFYDPGYSSFYSPWGFSYYNNSFGFGFGYGSGFGFGYGSGYGYGYSNIWNNGYWTGWYDGGGSSWNGSVRVADHGSIARRGESNPSVDNRSRGISGSGLGSHSTSSASAVSWDSYRPSVNRSGVRDAALNQVRSASSQSTPYNSSRQQTGESSSNATRSAAGTNAPSGYRPVSNVDAYNRQSVQRAASSQSATTNRSGGTASYSRPSSGQVYNEGGQVIQATPATRSSATQSSSRPTTQPSTTATQPSPRPTTTTTTTTTRSTPVSPPPSYSTPSYSAPSYSAPSYSAPSYSAPSSSSGGSSYSGSSGGSSSGGSSGGASRR